MTSSGPAAPGRSEEWGGLLLRGRLFLVSYCPLGIIFALQTHGVWSRAAWAAVAIFGGIDGYRLTYGQVSKVGHAERLVGITNRGGDVSGYLATYLLPFLAAPPSDLYKGAAYAVYFGVALVIYVRTSLILINPTLYVLGWQVVEGETRSGRRTLLLCRKTPSDGEEFSAVHFLGGLVRK